MLTPRALGRKEVDDACDLAKSCRRSAAFSRASDGASPSSPSFESEANPESPSPTSALHDALPQHSGRPGSAIAKPKKGHHHHHHHLTSKHPDQDGRGRQALTVYEAHGLAERFNLPTGHVSQAWKLFKRYDRHGRGLLGIHEFQMLLRSLLRDRYPCARDVPRELFEKLSDHKEVDFTEFLVWITRNSFSEFLLLSPAQRAIRNIARTFKKPVPFVEAIKREFDRFDINKNGAIEYKEFAELMNVLLGVQDPSELPDNRIRSFWREIDDNNSGVIDFSEFIPWYITYFDISGHAQGKSPLEEFYKKIRPVPFPTGTH